MKASRNVLLLSLSIFVLNQNLVQTKLNKLFLFSVQKNKFNCNFSLKN